MSNDVGFEISIKNYAASKNKTVQAVYQQMKRPENAKALEGHVFTRRIGNKDVKHLDQEAVRILDEASSATPVVFLQEDLKQELEEKTAKLDVAEKHAAFQEGKIAALKEMLAEKEQQLRSLSEPQSQIDVLKAQNADLKAESTKKGEILAEAEKTAQKLSDELTAFKTMSMMNFIKYKLKKGKKSDV